jgi:hypothetical protein
MTTAAAARAPRARAPDDEASTWLFVQPQFDGHHYTYLEHLVDGALQRGIRVVVGTGVDEQGTRIHAGLVARFGEARLRFVRVAGPPVAPPQQRLVPLVRGELDRRRFVKQVFRRASEDTPIAHVFLPYLDACLFAIAALGSPFAGTPWSGITMRQRFHMPAMGVAARVGAVNAAKGWLFRRLLRQRTLTRLLTNDETLGEFFAARRGEVAEKVVHVPDPSDAGGVVSRDLARERLGVPADACVVLIYGFLDGRKGMGRLLAWVDDARASGAQVVVLAVGQQAPEVRELLAGGTGRSLVRDGTVRVVDGFLPEADEPLYFGACDVVWLGYEQFEMMSGVLVKAAQQRRPVVFHDYGIIAHYARKHGVPLSPSPRCDTLLSRLPATMLARDFPAHAPVPDHSWENAFRLIFQEQAGASPARSPSSGQR